MIQVFPDLFVGAAPDLIHADNGSGGIATGWFVISAARDPWHREALGYTTRGAPKGDAEYLMARRERRLILNLFDADDPAFISEDIMGAAIEAIDSALDAGDKVLIHCNQGQSRAPGIALLWMRWGREPILRAAYSRLSVEDAIEAFGEVCPAFAPAGGITGYLRNHWEGE